MTRNLAIRPLTPAAFVLFGDVLDIEGQPDKLINQGQCGRYHDRAHVDFGEGGRAGISLFDAQPRALPYTLTMMERHPDGSQAFIPMHTEPFLVIVAEDAGNRPDTPRAFLTNGAQGVNFHRNIWHGVLTPLAQPGRFAVIDRIGDTPNLQEYWFDTPWQVQHRI
ncbi:ureidoglycolate lyase [Roseinatronobacter alkalisoli]|uniref:Ureidoglycolate lyase n=1 Tax=Roseinatronobacter alkalisoli TaxID=3028235 RepID=A0ABT5T6A4_9RHOB|nr:ureidoglycolate lyase [Roseinatronobacter sp. HJB301]MDD7969767.1 ureidoglycolate lyase [Roseinatronobacter sp. HJB301]